MFITLSGKEEWVLDIVHEKVLECLHGDIIPMLHMYGINKGDRSTYELQYYNEGEGANRKA